MGKDHQNKIASNEAAKYLGKGSLNKQTSGDVLLEKKSCTVSSPLPALVNSSLVRAPKVIGYPVEDIKIQKQLNSLFLPSGKADVQGVLSTQ